MASSSSASASAVFASTVEAMFIDAFTQFAAAAVGDFTINLSRGFSRGTAPAVRTRAQIQAADRMFSLRMDRRLIAEREEAEARPQLTPARRAAAAARYEAIRAARVAREEAEAAEAAELARLTAELDVGGDGEGQDAPGAPGYAGEAVEEEAEEEDAEPMDA